MGFFFRKSASIGPLRFNFSKSGVGASIGVPGARLTMTPRGATYITVGSHGFYYRESIPNGRRAVGEPSPDPLADTAAKADNIRTADVADLVDSSSENLVRQLNERAAMFNPAALLYVAAVLCICSGIAVSQNDLPMISQLALDHSASYDSLVAHFGYPDRVVASSLLSMVPVRRASYTAANMAVTFVPQPCTELYENVQRIMRDQKSSPTLARREIKKIHPCAAQPAGTWTAANYFTLDGDADASADDAKERLHQLDKRRDTPPVISFDRDGVPTGVDRSTQNLNQKSSVDRVWTADENVLAQSRGERERRIRADKQQTLNGYSLIFGGLGLFITGIVVHRKNMGKRTSRLFYELNELASQKFALVGQAVDHLSRAQNIWRVQSDSPTHDWKRNAGAASLVKRVPVRAGYGNPPHVECNVRVPTIDLGQSALYFMPDLILYCERGRFGAISYSDFQTKQSSTRFIEDGVVPGDAVQVGTTWQYVRVDGGPDRRFNNNRQMPILQYGRLTFQSARGLNIHLQTSNPEANLAFANCWGKPSGRDSNSHEQQRKTDPKSGRVSGSYVEARKILGVSDSANHDEISTAYRQLAQMYHPDKVAGLAPEFQLLADRRMKEINAAYELLKR